MRNNLYILILLLLSPIFAHATHLRAGEITATRVSGTQLTYRITLITYTDEINGKNANDGQNTVNFHFGYSTNNRVETITVDRKSRVLINRATVRNVYDTTYTFPAAGYYRIGCGIVNRNANTVNLPDPKGSDNISFFVQTTLLINANIGFNSTPVLLNAPLDSAAVGQRFIHNPGAFDIDGDSLSYKLTIPKKDQGNQGTTTESGIGIPIPEYLAPNTVGDVPVLNQAGTGPATFTIDPKTGDLIWDAPRKAGQYNVAFIIEEWRKGYDGGYVRIGEIIRDMQIIVVETENEAPILTVPEDICVEAGEKIEFEVVGEDENQQRLTLTSAGGVYNIDPAGNIIQFVAPEAAEFSSTPTVSKVIGKFSWQTNCKHAREQSYNVVFKVDDTPDRFNTQLTDLKSVDIRILPPRPKALVASEENTGNLLKWRALGDCGMEGKILVYRKSGCSGLNPGQCLSGMPASWNYTLIGEVGVGDSTYLDSKVEKGGIYSYRLVTQFKENEFINIQSAPSIEFCIGSEIKAGSPVIKKVSVMQTSKTLGEIEVKWSLPLNVTLSQLQGPFSYKLYRTVGIGGEDYTLIHTKTTTFADSSDLYFLDRNLNTEELFYRYKVEFYSQNTILTGTASPASSVKVYAKTGDKAVPLNWETNTPWINQTHYIYRESTSQPGVFNLIKKIETSDVNAFAFTDNGEDSETSDGDISQELVNGETYCYKVMTQGVYENLAEVGILENNSQIVCATPLDQSPPCTPTFSMSGQSNCEQIDPAQFCNESTFTNVLTWTYPTESGGSTCRNDIQSFDVFFGRYETDEPQIVATLPGTATSFSHQRNSLDGFAGCYTVRAKNSLDMYSEMSAKVCFDNCETLTFPNAFSPNGDGKNDTFTPMDCPAFVEEAKIIIYNAHGQKVRDFTAETVVWDGKNNDGKDLPSGTYYYVINVKFERLSETGSSQEYKGYVTLIK